MPYFMLRVIDFSTAYNTYEAQSCEIIILEHPFNLSQQLPINYDGIIAVYLGKAQWLYKNVSQFCNIWMKNSFLFM